MRVLMFGWEFPPHIAGGLGTACYGIVKGLAYNGVQTLFVMPSASGDEDQSAARIINASDVPVESFDSTVDEFLDKVKFVRIGSNMIPYVDPEEFHEMVESERRLQSENLTKCIGTKFRFSGRYGSNLMEEVAHYAMVGGTIAMEHKDEFDIIHAHDWLTYLAYDIEKRGMMAADKVIAVSDLTRNIVINKYGIDPEKVVTVHNAVDFSGRENLKVERGVRDKVVTFLGRITFQKGPEYFIEAAAKVLKRTSGVRFVMAGSGDMMNRCIRHVAKLGISDRFHFTGFLRGAEVQKMFAMSDVYIMPSVSEPFGISPLEAMRSNVPAIISNQSGAAEVLKYAFKVDFWDVDAMADDIYALLKYPALADFAAREGYDEVNRLKWNIATAKLKNIYESVVGGKE